MSKPLRRNNGKYAIMAPNHSKQLLKNLVAMVERHYLVDITICCGPGAVRAHKIILAANSPYFKEHLENRAIVQIIITGMEFTVLKAFIEYMYYGEMCVYEEHMKYFFAGAKLFQMPMDEVFTDNDLERLVGEPFTIPPPQFIMKSSNYSTMYKPLNSIKRLPPGYRLVTAYKLKRQMNPDKAEMSTYDDKQPNKVTLSSLGNGPLPVGNHKGQKCSRYSELIDDALLLASVAIPESLLTPQKFERSSLDKILLENHDGLDELDVPSLDENPPKLDDSNYQETDSLRDIMNSVNSTTMQTNNFETPDIDNHVGENPLMSEGIFDPNAFFNNTIDDTDI